MDYIDFIDAPAVRDHLRTLPPLPPAQRCILIAQSAIRPLADKLAALREIRDATPPEDFAGGCWTFQCDDPFPVILDRYLQTREKRLVEFRKAEPGVVYVLESGYRNYSALFSTFDAALASVKELEDDESPPVIRRRRIDDPNGATLAAELSRKLEIAEIEVRGGPDAGNMRIWGGDLPNGYAHVPHPFKRGDIVRQGNAYYVLDGSSEESVRFSWGTDESDMQLYGMSWDRPTGTFGHAHIFYTRGGTELVAPADLPEEQQMLVAVSLLMREKYDLITFLQCFTCGDKETLEKDAVADVKREAFPKKRKDEDRILRSDLPGLPANLFLHASCFRGFPKAVRVQRSGDAAPHYRDTVELTLEAEPRFNGGTGDLSPDDVKTIRAFVACHLDAFLANWDGKMSFDDLLAALRDGRNDTVYTTIMSPVGQHPSKCRIGVCSGTPILESGWILHSSLITENAERIYAEIIENTMDAYNADIDYKNYIDFIDSRTLRDYYRTTPLPPAMMCILIAQSHCRPLADKLAALREILAATAPEDFADGEYQLACNDSDFAAALERHIRRKEERLADFLAPSPDVVYVPHDPRGGYDLASFATFAECLAFMSPIDQPDDRYISIERCRVGNPSATLSGYLGPGKTLFDVETPEDNRIDSGYEEWRWNFAKSFVRVPHPFRPGDIVQWGDERFSVVVHPELPPVPKRWSSGIDFCDQHFHTLRFRPDRTHPCGGVFSIDDVMPAGSISALERVDPEELPEEYGVLLSVAEVVAGRTCICQLLEAYSQGALDSLLKFTREQRAKRNESDRSH